jgi:DNA repair exonuclease SbcCD ATPase subunit
MLDIESIELRNFLSYGDYVTKIKVSKQGPTLVLGKVENDEETNSSNGAGKSSLLTAFIWGLFGRTITNSNPGDKVVNFFVGSTCYVKIKTSDGWEIVRTRDCNGHSELVLLKDGDDETKSTNTNAQKKLNELFGLDYEIFTSSIFCGQFGKPFLEMAPVKRKEAIERLLGLDKLNGYADAAKGRSKEAEVDQGNIRSSIDVLKSSDEQYQDQIRENLTKKMEFDLNKKTKIAGLAAAIIEAQEKIEEAPTHDVEKLEKRWSACNEVASKINEYNEDIEENNNRITILQGAASRARSTLERYSEWEPEEEPDIEKIRSQLALAKKAEDKIAQLSDKSIDIKTEIQHQQIEVNALLEVIQGWGDQVNSNCASCLQEIGIEHASKQIEECEHRIKEAEELISSQELQKSKVDEVINRLKQVKKPEMTVAQAQAVIKSNNLIRDEIDNYQSVVKGSRQECVELAEANEKLEMAVASIGNKLDQLLPDITLDEARAEMKEYAHLCSQEQQLKDRIEEIRISKNPHALLIDGLKELLKTNREKLKEFDEKLENLDTLFKHYRYIHRSYSDRRKIKKWLMSELIPYLNNRVHYYLDKFDVNMNIKFTSTLDVESDKWSYEFCSGGERKRIDLSIMFGLYDLYTSIYGRQCNIMVLDEVDSKLDKHGVEAFADIINDLTASPESPDTVYVISHKRELESVFPTQIVIRKRNMFSVVDQT